MNMEPLFAVRMTHDEDMYYNQVLASKQAAPVEKAGFYRGNTGQLNAFLE